MSRAHSTDRKLNSVGPAEIIFRGLATNIRNKFANKVPNLSDKLDRKRRTAVGYYRFKRLGFNNGDEIEDWLDTEGE